MSYDPRNALNYLQEQGWMGELGFALIVGAIASACLHIWGVDGTLWQVPLALVYGGGGGLGVFLLTASLRLIPDRDQPSEPNA